MTTRPPLPVQLQRVPVLAILRGLDTEATLARVDVLAKAGIGAVEVTLDSPGALETIRALRRRDDGLMAGAGTVMDAVAARRAVDAGAELLVSPHVDPAVTCVGTEARIGHLPGALTPTEIVAAWRSGATAVKLFPAGHGGPAMVRALRGPLPDIPLVPTGGVDATNAACYLRAGATAVAVGSAFTNGTLDEVEDLARALVASCLDARR